MLNGSGDALTHLFLTIAGAALGGIFTAGGFYMYVRMSIDQLKKEAAETHHALDLKIDKNFETQERKISETKADLFEDLKGIGIKVGVGEKDAARRYHNVSMAIMLAVPQVKEDEVSNLLRE